MNYLLIKKIGRKGRGVFAQKPFKKDEVILRMDKSDAFTDKDMESMSQYALSHAYTLGGGKNFRMKLPEKYINHSCNPNAFDRQGVVRAMRNIKKGDEITYDYSISSDDTWWMKCRCNSSKCRKTVSGRFVKLPKDVQKKYLPYLEGWYKKKFRKHLEALKWK